MSYVLEQWAHRGGAVKAEPTDKSVPSRVDCDHHTVWRPILEAWRPQPGVMEAYSVVDEI